MSLGQFTKRHTADQSYQRLTIRKTRPLPTYIPIHTYDTKQTREKNPHSINTKQTHIADKDRRRRQITYTARDLSRLFRMGFFFGIYSAQCVFTISSRYIRSTCLFGLFDKGMKRLVHFRTCVCVQHVWMCVLTHIWSRGVVVIQIQTQTVNPPYLSKVV